MDEAARFKVLHVLKEAGPRVGVIAVQALLGGQLQHAQPERKDVDAARVLVVQIILRQHSCVAASLDISHRLHMPIFRIRSGRFRRAAMHERRSKNEAIKLPRCKVGSGM